MQHAKVIWKLQDLDDRRIYKMQLEAAQGLVKHCLHVQQHVT